MPNLRIESSPAPISVIPGFDLSLDANGTPRTLTAAQFGDAEYNVIVMAAILAGAGTVTTPTLAQLSALTGRGTSPTTFYVRIINASTGAFAWTLVGGTGVSVVGTAAIPQTTFREFQVTVSPGVGAVVTALGGGVQG